MQPSKLFFLTATLIILLDQISKLLVTHFIPYTTNTGAAFGILQNQQPLLISIALFVLGLVIYYRKESPLALGLLLGGTLGNLLDRFFRGHVIDFIDLGFWPSFNIADSSNVIGVGLLIYFMYKEKS